MTILKDDHTARKSDHLRKTIEAQVKASDLDKRFSYEPILSGNFIENTTNFNHSFLGKKLKFPLWISSMTGGTDEAIRINKNMAKACRDFGLGMGLGSCRQILKGNFRLKDFDVRHICGDEVPLYCNIGIGQVEELILNNELNLLEKLIKKLDADGLILHVNPLQEYIQPEGDRYKMSPIECLSRLFDYLGEKKLKIIVKEVGQGMGEESLRALFSLPISAIELAGFGGTNFSKIEQLRDKDQVSLDVKNAFIYQGHTSIEMIKIINKLKSEFKTSPDIIISGGINSAVDALYLRSLCQVNSVYGLASRVLKYGSGDYEQLKKFLTLEIEAYKMASKLLKIKDSLIINEND